MAKGVYDLGIGQGYIYTVDVDGTTIIKPWLNTPENARKIKLDAVQASSVALNRSAYATITVDTVTGVSSITNVRTPDDDMIDPAATIAFTGATTTDELASDIADAINSYAPTSLPDFTATVVGSVVTVYATPESGSNYNGDTISIGLSAGNATFTITSWDGGSDTSELYDESYGYRFFLNADYNATGCAGSGSATPDSLTNAVEITDYLIPRSLNSAIDVQSLTIASGAISFTRKSTDTLVYIDTEASAASDDLDTITAIGFADGDKITFRGADSGRVVTVKDNTGNIQLQSDVDFSTAGFEVAITLQLKDSVWYEVSRTSQSIGSTSDYRTAGFGFFGVDEFQTQVVATSGTTTFVGGTDDKFQELTGGVTLVGNTTYDLGAATNGDEFWLSYDASTTVSGNNLTIFGITLSDEQALNGGLIFYARYVEGAWKSFVSPNLDPGLTNPYSKETKVADVEDTLKTETITRRVSFENGEECDNQVKMGYPGTVTEIYFTVDKAIASANNGTITPKNNAGTAMTDGLITVTASSALDTGFTSTPTGNNTFVAGDVLKFTTAKTNKGGFGTLSIKVTKS
jgi:hypothetical protein